LHHGKNAIQACCLDSVLMLNTRTSKITVIFFTRNSSDISFNYKLCNALLARS
jgi:hypothetical protein